jgi:hypothetical protein
MKIYPFTKTHLFLSFLFLLFSTLTFGQGATCATAETLVIDGACDTSTSLTQTINTAVCGVTAWRRVGYYTFTVSSGPQNVTITANSGNRNLVLGLFSGACASLTNVQCVNADNNNNSAQTETITANLTNGTYYIAVGNLTNNDMTLNSICVTTTPISYCTIGTTSNSYWINNFSTTGGLTNISNTTTYSTGGYGNFTAQSVSQVAGSSFNFNATTSSGTHGINIWIDWNNDGDFADAGEKAYASGGYVASATGTITIPGGAAPGNYRMRVVANWSNTDPASCGSTTYTEAEDYTIQVVVPAACSGAPTAGTTTTSPTTGNPGSNYTVSATGFTVATGLTFQWQSNTNSAGWVNEGASTSTYANYNATAPALGSTVTWRLVVTCTASGQSANSATSSFTSTSTLNVPQTGSNTVTCGTNITLYDNGGPSGNYVNNSNGHTVLQAGLGGIISITGSYATEGSNIDYIRIYNGTGTGGTILATYSGTGTINYTGTAGQTLTIQFYSDGSVVNTGFALSVTYSGTCFPACSGTPTGGTVAVSPVNGGPGSSYTVSATGMTLATGMTYQWQSNTNGAGWVNAGASTSTYSNFNATAPGTVGTTVAWQLVVTCTNSSQTATSTSSTFTVVSTLNIPTTGSNSVTCGTNITLYDNGGPSGDYSNNADGFTVLEAGLGATITISGSYVTESVDDIIIYSGSGTGGTVLGTYSGTGTINYTGAPGQTLTIRFDSDSSIVYSGFALSITYSGVCFPVCSGTPVGGTVSTSPNTDWPGNPYVVSATGYTQALDLLYQWQFSTDGGATWTNAGAATSTYANYNAVAPASGNVNWQLVVTCTNSGQSATSNVGVFVTMAVSDVVTGCPNVISGGLNLNGADPAPFNCTDTTTCVDLEATFLDLGDTTNYTVEAIQYNPPIPFNGLANPVSVNLDDIWSPVVNLPFDFCFFGNTYNQCLIGSNGMLTFDLTSNSPGGGTGYSFSNNLPSTTGALFANTIYGVYHDIDPRYGGQVGWELITLPSGCRALVASWNEVPMYSNNSLLYTGMMVLYENSNVIEVYIQEKRVDGTWNGGNAIVGIQNATATAAVVAPGRNALDADWTTFNEAWRFVPAGPSIATLTWYEGAGTTGPVVGNTPVLNVCPTATTTYTAEITYTLCDGRTITEIDQTTVTVNGAKVWNGSVNTDWDVANNWTPTGIPTAADCVVIPDVTNDPIVSGGNYNGLGLNLTIQNNALLTVESDNAVTITDWININAGGDLQLNNSASLIQINNNANQGIMHMDRTASIRKLDYVYWSSPVASFSSSAISPGTNAGYIYKWAPTVANGTYASDFGKWVGGNEIMALGKGYIVRGPDAYTATHQNYTATFVGTPNNGVINTPIQRSTYTGAPYVGPTTTMVTLNDDNWNLLGNPYPSALNADAFLTANAANISGFVKIWTHGTLPSNMIVDPFYEDYQMNYTVADYITYNSLGSTPPGYNGMIGAGQGFFVLMNDLGATNESVIFNNTMRSHTFDNSQFYRTTENSEENSSIEKHRIWLDLVSPTGTNTKTLIGYATGASNNLDNAFDAPALGVKASFELYSIAENKELLIQGRTLPFDNNDQVPLGVTAPNDGMYTIALSLVDGRFLNTDQNIYVEDKLLNIIHDLKAAPYHFTIEAGTNENRFVLRYTNETLGNNDFLNDNSVLVVSNTNLSVVSTKNTIQSVLVFDVLGRLLVNKQNVNSLEVPLHEVQKNKAPLVVQITLTNGTKVNKKVVY